MLLAFDTSHPRVVPRDMVVCPHGLGDDVRRAVRHCACGLRGVGCDSVAQR